MAEVNIEEVREKIHSGMNHWETSELLYQTLRELERLRAENKKLRKALHKACFAYFADTSAFPSEDTLDELAATFAEQLIAEADNA